MQRKEIVWIAALVILGVVYVHFFTNWFAKKELVITPSRRPPMGGDATVESIVFSLNGQYKIKSVEVLEAKDGKLDPHGHVVWHLVSDSASAPTQAFAYGRRIHGMKQAPDNSRAEPLQPDVVYWIEVATDHLTGKADFETRATAPNG